MRSSSSEIIQTLESTGALLNGHFELRSKLHSNRFFQCAILQYHPRVFAELCGQLAHLVADANLGPLDCVIAPALGGIVAGHEVARHLELHSIFAEKSGDALVMRRFSIKPARYLVVEDVVTRGGRVDETIALVRQGGGEVAGVAVLVDRSAGKAAFDAPLISLLRMAPELWEPTDCPMCRAGEPLVRPGS